MAEHLQLVRNHGEVVIDKMENRSDSDIVNIIGWNYRLTEVQAAIGVPQIQKLGQLNKIRVTLAEMLTFTSKVSPFATSSAQLIPHPGT